MLETSGAASQRTGGAMTIPDHTSEQPHFKKCRKGDQCSHPDGPLLPIIEFGYSKRGRDGFNPRCRACMSSERRARHEARPELRQESRRRYQLANAEKIKERDRQRRARHPSARAIYHASGLKRCPGCKAYHPRTAEYFHRNRNSFDGLVARCKACAIKATRRHYQATIEQRRETQRRYRAENPEKAREASLRWQRNNPQKLKVRWQRRQARKKALPAQLTAAQWEWLVEQSGHCCVYCGKHESEVGPLAQEHVLPVSQGGGYTIFNIRPSCASDNSRKGGRTPEQAGMIMVIEINPLAYMDQLPLFGGSGA
jgi:hypothetical protein